MTDSIDGLTSRGADAPQTLGQAHLYAERSGTRRAVLRWRTDGRWQEIPAWRFYRQVIRIALFMQERMGVQPGDHVLVASPLRSERVVAEWATVTVGAVAVLLDEHPTDIAPTSRFAELAPKLAFVAGPEEAARVSAARDGAAPRAVIAFDLETHERSRSWAEVLDLGGTLDTAERAQAFRSRAREQSPDMPAIAYRQLDNGAPMTVLTHAEVIARVRTFWKRVPPREGDLAYIASGGPAGEVCLPLWAFVADGRTSTALGTPGRDADEVGELRPQLLVGPPVGSSPRRGLDARPRGPVEGIEATSVSRLSLLDLVPGMRALRGRLRRGADDAKPGDFLREIVNFDGTPVENEKRRLP